MSKEFEFFLKADLSKYKGLYIAIIDDKVVSSGDNAKQVLEYKRKYPNKAPTIAKMYL
ncbi:MAG TPA: succinyl-CoA synthetase subunit alpha [Archaeoglobaceae archaeon]|nr:succinyl-CoA synthetase subunit alpha [Archaeoglobaceae archaeon]